MADVLTVDGLDVTFQLHESEVHAVSDLDFTLVELLLRKRLAVTETTS